MRIYVGVSSRITGVGIDGWKHIGTEIIIGVIYREKICHEGTTTAYPSSICYLVIATRSFVGFS
jgi:hypothetical protein